MKTTSSLHFRVAMDPTTGRACIQNKQTIDVHDWSPVEYIWNSKVMQAGEPHEFTSWLDALVTAASVPIDESRHIELRKYLSTCSWRLETEQLRALQEKVDQLYQPRLELLPVHWDDNGKFRSEYDREEEQGSEDAAPEPALQLPDGNCIILRPTVRQALRGEDLANYVTVGKFIAYRPFYNDDVPMSMRKSHYVGKVTHVNSDEKKVQISCYHTSDLLPLKKVDHKRTVYKPWRSGSNVQDVKADDIFYVFQPDMPDDDGKTTTFAFTSTMKDYVSSVLAAEEVEANVASAH
jgi:hypothetical protein